MTQETKYEFNFGMTPAHVHAGRLGLTQPDLAGCIREVNVGLWATEQEAMEIFQQLLPDQDDPGDGIRRRLGGRHPDVDEIMDEKLPEFARRHSEDNGVRLAPRELRDIALQDVQGMLDAAQCSLWENFDRRYELNERLLRATGVVADNLLTPA